MDVKISIHKESAELDDYNEKSNVKQLVINCFADKTEFGGRENVYASRIVHDNEIVFTIRWRWGIEAGMFVCLNGKYLKIISVHEEGRRKYLHLKTVSSDAES